MATPTQLAALQKVASAPKNPDSQGDGGSMKELMTKVDEIHAMVTQLVSDEKTEDEPKA